MRSCPTGGRLVGVLVTYDRLGILAETLQALSRQTRKLDHLIVIDNGNDPEVAGLVAEPGAGQTTYRGLADNSGPAGGLAAGMAIFLAEFSPGDVVVLLDDDDPPPDCAVFEDLERGLQEQPLEVAGVALDGAHLDVRRARLVPLRPVLTAATDVDYLKGDGCPTYRYEAMQQCGVFDERLFFGFDDLEYGLRLRRSGLRVKVLPGRPRAGEQAAAAPGKRVEPWAWRRYYSVRNFVHLLASTGRPWAMLRYVVVVCFAKPLVNLPRHPVLSTQHLRWNIEAVFHGLTGRLGRTVAPESSHRPGKVRMVTATAQEQRRQP